MEPVATDDVFEADPGGFPRSRSEPRSQKKVMKHNFPAPGLLHVSPVVTGASASVGALYNPAKLARLVVGGL
jgi:hypothetical protein